MPDCSPITSTLNPRPKPHLRIIDGKTYRTSKQYRLARRAKLRIECHRRIWVLGQQVRRILFPGPTTFRSPRYLTLRPRGKKPQEKAAVRDVKTKQKPKDGEAHGANAAGGQVADNAGGQATDDAGGQATDDAGGQATDDAGGQATDDAGGIPKEKATSGPEASGGKMAPGYRRNFGQ